MSHFTVLVAAHGEVDLYNKLIPYYEYGCSKENDRELERRGYLRFCDVEQEYRDSYASETVEMVEMPDGRRLFTWDDEFKRGDFLNTSHQAPEHLERVNVPFNELYATFEVFIKEWAGYEKNAEGSYGYFYNPDKKWDWYSIGGRWSGLLMLKDSATVLTKDVGRGDAGTFGRMNYDWDRADYALVGDVDWDGIRQEQFDNEMENYRIYQEAAAKAEQQEPSPETVRKARERSASLGGKWSVEELTRIFQISDILREEYDKFFFSSEKFDVPEQEFVAEFEYSALTYAFVNLKGEWYQRGEMGWWGMDDEEQGDRDYDALFWRFVESLPDNQRVYVVDCHI